MTDTVPVTQGLKPCPFCDAPGYFVRAADRVKCTRPSCGAEGGRFERHADAIATWQARATPSPEAAPAAEIERAIADFDAADWCDCYPQAHKLRNLLAALLHTGSESA